MSDLLRLDYINSLPQPFIALQWDSWEWPVILIDVETGLMQIDVCGKTQNTDIGDVKMFIDANGDWHDPETFYSDYEPEVES